MQQVYAHILVKNIIYLNISSSDRYDNTYALTKCNMSYSINISKNPL